MPVEPATPEELAALGALIDRWAAGERETNAMLLAVDHDPAERRWYIRMKGEEKTTTTVWLTLRQRTVHYETYFMPAPEENVAACYEYLLRANLGLFAMRFAIGPEDALYLVGQMPFGAVDDGELDRIIGACWAYSERYFRPAMAIGYASVFKPR
ncbi:MAG: YbjN domain-containing protein [Actinobacteria bacterium]|nr:YbjN domain-containing protein [Actinomycetota bacterium]